MDEFNYFEAKNIMSEYHYFELDYQDRHDKKVLVCICPTYRFVINLDTYNIEKTPVNDDISSFALMIHMIKNDPQVKTLTFEEFFYVIDGHDLHPSIFKKQLYLIINQVMMNEDINSNKFMS